MYTIYIGNCNDCWNINFISAVLQECSIRFDLANHPEIDSLDDFVKCLSSNNINNLNKFINYGYFKVFSERTEKYTIKKWYYKCKIKI